MKAATPPQAAGSSSSITIKNFMFMPSTLSVKVGQKVVVTNEDESIHTIRATDKSFDSHNLSKGQIYTFSVAKPGTYTYLCDIHQYMTGTLKVS